MHQYDDLIMLFNRCFAADYHTRLVKGDEEPLYLPASEKGSFHSIFFAHGFFSSALHECAHWLIAGDARRQLEDYGYWYKPDGRNHAEQQQFQQVEVKPQALEWILSKAANYSFRLSLDNLTGNPHGCVYEKDSSNAFKQAIFNQVREYSTQGLSKRAALFRAALCAFYNTDETLDIRQFDFEEI